MKKFLAVITALMIFALPLSGLALTTSSTPVPGSSAPPAATAAPAIPAEPESAPDPVIPEEPADPEVPESPEEPANPEAPASPEEPEAAPDPVSPEKPEITPDPKTISLPDLIPTGYEFASKYMAEGQRLVTDVTLEPGSTLLEGLAEEGSDTAVKDLLSAMTLEVTTQQTEGLSQAALRLLLNDETAADLILATGEKGFYLSSGLLGNRIINIDQDQLADLANVVTQQMVEEGSIRQSDLDAMSQDLPVLVEAVETLLQPFTVDLGALNAALDALGERTPPEALTEVPEGLTIQAARKYTVTLTKKALADVTTELARLLWTVPAVPKLAPVVGEEDWTEEKLIDGLNEIPALLQEDLVLTVYTDETEQNMEIHAAPKLLLGWRILAPEVVLVISRLETGISLSGTVDIPQGEDQFIRMTGNLSLEEDLGVYSLEWYDTVSQFVGESEYVQSVEAISAAGAMMETEAAVSVSLFSAALPSPEESPVMQAMDLYWETADLGDHAEASGTIRIGTSDAGDLMTVNVKQTTDLGEAYIVTADAVRPIDMNEEEQEQFAAQMTFSAALEAIRLITRLPASVQTLIWRSLFSPEETGIMLSPGT
ncbi:MAG: hypothetical protein IJI09_09650 [Clostridia bacterium]|nr:hypothetical protein [Clostridia bacterium]